ncbi:hypothetical protein PC9H_011595 [Pleurotus ostreatus]|uniref:Fungal-type protein kinase domain-containing protein n=1 Tax=Pleurotus ostreatus TaxID=5322 RepID=A0A8H7DLM1_PLEOS|nr:uncharacterized protein PC9H_011595 [Pleurotus ostreatus]KAF7421075.1 hypothetical protein PC9H_011595 [Pleurotus ostreatus]KAJ8690588.1 hypothetical protein PTI98_012004 [Pleurotus ostreatus]
MDPSTNGYSSTDSLHHYNYYNFYSSTESFSEDDCSTDDALRAELFGRISRDVDMEDYVQYVYGVSKADIEYIRSKEWKVEGLPTYTKLLNEGAQKEDLYEPFQSIIADLFDTFTNDGRKLDVHHTSLDETTLKGVWNVGNPDQLFFFGSHDEEAPIAWSLAKAFVEFAVTPRTQRTAASDSTIGIFNEEGTTATAALAVSSPGLVPTPTLTTRSSTKRKHSSTDTLDGPMPASKRPKLVVFTRKEMQAAGYALELLASACRRWATGVVIIDTQVALHYYDRMGAIYTQPFKFDEEPWKLALFALAIGQCDPAQAGFEPLVAPNTDTLLSQPLFSVKNAILRLPKYNSSKDSAYEGDDDKVIGNKVKGEAAVEKVWSHFKITGDPLYVSGSLTGRGSHVLPGDLVEESPAQDHSEGVASKEKQGAESGQEGTMVAKLSWPMEKRPYFEADTVKDLVDKIPWMTRHLPRIHCAISLKSESMGLPRRLFHDMTIAYGLEQRYFTLLFSDRYKHLWEVKTLIGFQMAYIDIVECHRTVTKYGKVLHRDISENNLLWTNDKRVVGVLNDWDLATPVDAVGNSTNHRTGTGPFMAYDLLGPEPPVHLYRHDLESLFYVLIWAVVHYNIGSDIPYSGAVNPVLKTWTGDYGEARNAKHAFLGDPEPVLRNIQPVFKSLRALWIQPLCNLFRQAQVNRDNLANLAHQAQEEVIGTDLFAMRLWDEDQDDDEGSAPSPTVPQAVAPSPAPRSDDIDFETLGDCLTFEKFMAALGGSRPVGIPKKYRAYAESLLAVPK